MSSPMQVAVALIDYANAKARIGSTPSLEAVLSLTTSLLAKKIAASHPTTRMLRVLVYHGWKDADGKPGRDYSKAHADATGFPRTHGDLSLDISLAESPLTAPRLEGPTLTATAPRPTAWMLSNSFDCEDEHCSILGVARALKQDTCLTSECDVLLTEALQVSKQGPVDLLLALDLTSIVQRTTDLESLQDVSSVFVVSEDSDVLFSAAAAASSSNIPVYAVLPKMKATKLASRHAFAAASPLRILSLGSPNG